MANYVTLDITEKIDLLKQLERRQIVGPVSVSQQGGGVRTEFDTKGVNLERQITELIAAILADPEFTSDNPLWDALQQARRGGTTRVVFC